MCDIQGPYCVAVTANQTILVSTAANTLCKVTHEGTSHLQHQNKEIYANDLNQDHRSTKWRWSRDQEDLQERMDDLMNAALIIPEE